MKDMKNKIIEQKEIISKYEILKEEQEKIQNQQLKQIKVLENQIHEYEYLKDKITEQETILSKYQKENEELQQSFLEQKSKFKSFDEKFTIRSQLSAKVESYQKIVGVVNIKEGIAKLDKKRSKIIINTNKVRTLGESEYQKGTEITDLTQKFTFNKSSGTYFIHALIVDSFGQTEELISNPLNIKDKRIKFEYTGRAQKVQLNPGTYKFEVWGSSGGENNIKDDNKYTYSGAAGKGGYSVGTIKLMKNTTFYVYVGGCPNSSNGGWNGGGSANSPGAGGGGSSDISLYGEEGSSEWNTSNHMLSRLIVAGGGGGSSSTYYPKWQGGSGGGQNGDNNGSNEVKGGTQTGGYKFGIGESNTSDGNNSGGGGGWYGGGAYNNFRCWGRGGGGGSGFVYNSSTAINYPSGCMLDSSFYLTDSKTISGNTEIPTTTGNGTEYGHVGNGYAIITPI